MDRRGGRGVQFEKRANGDVYLLNDRQELKRLQFGLYWSTVATGVLQFEMAWNGTLHVLDNRHQPRMYASLDRYYVLPTPSQSAVSIPSFGEIVELAGIAPADALPRRAGIQPKSAVSVGGCESGRHARD